MKPQWFESWGWIYRPIAWQGILVSFLALLDTCLLGRQQDSSPGELTQPPKQGTPVGRP
jgi:hypothetical protein